MDMEVSNYSKIEEHLEQREREHEREREREYKYVAGERAIDWFVHSSQNEAIILGEAVGKCTCLVDGEEKFCFAEDGVGVLNSEQQSQCREITEVPMTAAARELKEGSSRCKDKTGDMVEWGMCAIKT